MKEIPPKEVPKELINKYTMGGKIRVKYLYLNDSYPPEKPLIYTKEEVHSYIEKVKQHQKKFVILYRLVLSKFLRISSRIYYNQKRELVWVKGRKL